MNVVFRADASLEIGSGHVMRCLTLADALKAQGADCHFVCRERPGHLAELICERGYTVTLLPAAPLEAYTQNADEMPTLVHAAWLGTGWHVDASQTRAVLEQSQPDWLIVDHYALDSRWEAALRGTCKRLMVIDDLGDRSHDCDLLLDQNLDRTTANYSNLVPAECTVLVGPQYALLRPEFATLREYSLKRRRQPRLETLLISMGGFDPHNATGAVLEALKLCPLPPGCRIIVVMGRHAPYLERVQELSKHMPWACEIRVGVQDMAQLMADSDLAIGAAGSTSWERCCLGLPSMIMVLASNQKASAAALSSAGAAYLLDEVSTIEHSLATALASITEGDCLVNMSRAASGVCNGYGVERVIRHFGWVDG